MTITGSKLLFVVNQPAFFISHRLALALAAKSAGYEVHVATQLGTGVAQIEASGLTHHAIPLRRGGRNPFSDIRLLWSLVRLFQRVNPSLVHLVTIKPVIFGGVAARISGVPGIVAAIPGLGYMFTQSNALNRLILSLIKFMYRFALGSANQRVIFQNRDDQRLFASFLDLPAEHTVLIPGSGVALSEYLYVPEPVGQIVVTMASRLLKDKGVGEFIAGARILKERGIKARFNLAGTIDPENPASCANADVALWKAEGVVQLLGHCDHIPKLFSQSHIVVLPSYREGLPKVLIEAAACGRAVVTTDVPGCRDAIQSDVTGILVKAGDSAELANAIQRLIEQPQLRQSMGAAGRIWAENQFDIQCVISKHLEIYKILSRLPSVDTTSVRQ